MNWDSFVNGKLKAAKIDALQLVRSNSKNCIEFAVVPRSEMAELSLDGALADIYKRRVLGTRKMKRIADGGCRTICIHIWQN